MAQVARIFAQLVQCVGHLHDRGLLHGDIKPLNCVRIDNQWKLIDLDAVCVLPSPPSSPFNSLDAKEATMGHGWEEGRRTVHGKGGSGSAVDTHVPAGIDMYACRKSSSCYVPPEAIHLDEDTQQVGIFLFFHSRSHFSAHTSLTNPLHPHPHHPLSIPPLSYPL